MIKVKEREKMDEKTNVMRLLDQKKIKYNHYSYIDTPATNGVEVANLLNQDERMVFKDLGNSWKE